MNRIHIAIALLAITGATAYEMRPVAPMPMPEWQRQMNAENIAYGKLGAGPCAPDARMTETDYQAMGCRQ